MEHWNRRPLRTDELADRPKLQAELMRHADKLARYVESKIPNDLRGRVSTEDILQETWIAAFRCATEFRETGPDSFERWLTSIVDSRLLSAMRDATRLRRDARRAVRQPDRSSAYWNLLGQIAATGDRTPSSEDAAKEAVHAVQIALGALSDDYRNAVTLRHLEGRPVAEVASAMRRSQPAVHGLLHRGLRKLRERLGSVKKYLSGDERVPVRRDAAS